MRLGWMLIATVWALGLGGCGEPAAEPRPVSFGAAQQAPGPVTVEGELQSGSLVQATGQPTVFTLKEPEGGATMIVAVPAGVTVPANLVSSERVVVTGRYQADTRQFQAESVESKVPTREEQH